MSLQIHKNVFKDQLCGTIGRRIGEDKVKDWLDIPEYLLVRETGDLSDGYHTFDELYEFRKVYNAALFNEWAKENKYSIHKSKRHHDGQECFGGGWFIVMAELPTGQISNHYELKDWDLFKCEEREKANEWDGHTPQDVVDRLIALQNEDSK